MRVKTKRLEYKLKQYGVNTKYIDGWDSSKIDPYNGKSNFWGVLLHHTAGTNSLNWVVNSNPYAPVRACHFLVDKDGTVNVVSGVGAYHAGKGGPWRFPNGPTILGISATGICTELKLSRWDHRLRLMDH